MQLTAADLRIWNLVLCDGKTCKVVSLEEDGIGVRWPIMRAYTHKYASVEPIPLTEEWLIKFGFKKDSEDIYHYNFFKASFIADNPMWFGQSGCCQDETIKENIKYVHELQNIYYALTNQELLCN